MTDTEAARWNAKYPRFYLSRYSGNQGKYLLVGKGYTDIRAALKAAALADTRNPKYMTFIDVKAA